MEYRSIRGGQVVHPALKSSVNEQNTKTLFFVAPYWWGAEEEEEEEEEITLPID